MSKRTRRITAQAAVLTCAAATVSIAVATPARADQTVTQSFTSPGEYAVTIPLDGVSSMHVVAVGGTGARTAADLGGRGAIVTADLPVAAGKTYYVEVGGNGSEAAAGGGGGASDIRTISVRTNSGATGLSSRLLVAAGGGGAADSNGGDAGSAGSPPYNAVNDAGGAGSATAGGNGGCVSGDHCGSNGSFGAGGAGGGVGAPSGGGGANGGGPAGSYLPIQSDPYWGGGGGGGGWYGGGGGGSAYGTWGIYAGGGGGGSNLVPSGGTVALDNNASPQITITYTVAIPTVTSLTVVPSVAVHGVTYVTLSAIVHAKVSVGSGIMPAGSGSVQFWAYEGGLYFTALGPPVAANLVGLATRVTTLPQGTIDVYAIFNPAANAPYASSGSPLVPVTVA